MSDKITTAKISENKQSPYAVTIEVSGHKILGDEPHENSGLDLGPSPFDLLCAALGECTAMTVRWAAHQKNWPLEHVEVILTHKKVDDESKTVAGGHLPKVDMFEKVVTIKGDQLTDTQRESLLKVAAKCPVQKTLEGAPVIITRSAVTGSPA